MSDIRKLGDVEKLADTGIEALEKALAELNAGIRRDTPVDTGTLKASWIESIGKPSKFKPVYKRPYSGVRAVSIKKKLGQVYYFVNNQDYAPFVEYGTAKMQPRAMLRRNIAKWPGIVRRAAK